MADWMHRVAHELEQLRPYQRELFDSITQHVGCAWFDWPASASLTLLKADAKKDKNLKNVERMQLTLWALGNRVPPDLYVEWLLARNMLSDKSARESVARQLRQHVHGELGDKYFSPALSNFSLAEDSRMVEASKLLFKGKVTPVYRKFVFNTRIPFGHAPITDFPEHNRAMHMLGEQAIKSRWSEIKLTEVDYESHSDPTQQEWDLM